MKQTKIKPLRTTGEDAYFAASNSAYGFHSYYGECFDRKSIGRLYAIKGGPGTGKSRFMREAARAASRAGWRAEMIYCSSDPESLDGVILMHEGEEIAILDATAPHVYEPIHPGVREEIINLGQFWDAGQLRAHRGEIDALNRRKAEAYRRAYRYLAGYGAMEENSRQLTAPYLRERAIEDFAAKLLQSVPNGAGFRAQTSLIHSIGMRGSVGFDTYFAQASKIFLLEDCRGSAERMMEALYRRAAEKELSVRVSRDPIIPDRLDGLFLRGCGYAFAVCSPEECSYPFRKISMRRFVNTAGMRAVRSSVNFADRMRRAMLTGAMDELDTVREIHFQMEQIYADAMDFPAKEAYTKDFCKQLFGTQGE